MARQKAIGKSLAVQPQILTTNSGKGVVQRQTHINKDLAREFFTYYEGDAEFNEIHSAIMDQHNYNDDDLEGRDDDLEHQMRQEALLRRARLERHRHMRALNDLDLIASMILAVVWSGIAAPTRDTQDRISLQTVAVASVGGRLHVACNGFTWANVGAGAGAFRTQDMIQAAIAADGEGRPLEFIDPPGAAATANYHAEMQLVDRLGGSALRGQAIGVSKPCCLKCKEVLDAEGILFSTYDNFDPRDRWQAPTGAYRWNMDQLHEEYRRENPWLFGDDDDDDF